MQRIEFVSGASLWYHRDTYSVSVRWVSERTPDNSIKPVAFFCSDPRTELLSILKLIVSRRDIEVAFEELRTITATRQITTR